MDLISGYLPTGITLGLGLVCALALRFFMSRTGVQEDGKMLALQLVGWLLGLMVLVAVLVVLPISDAVRGQILSLLGVVITAIIALASTTFVANAIAGIMLQATQPFRPGDFVQVDGVFGRVTHRALVHTRIQTETRDFTTVPNLLLVTNPFTVLHRDGTIIQADVSLGYDVHHSQAEAELLKGAQAAGLADPYVLVTELLDHAVNYRVSGFLSDMNHPLSARSALRKQILDHLHAADIEITSPSVVAQRQQPGDTRFLPEQSAAPATPKPTTKDSPEQKIFDSADQAAAREALKAEIDQTMQDLDSQKQKVKDADADTKKREEAVLNALSVKLEGLQSQLEQAPETSP